MTIVNFSGAVKAGDLLLVGECSECRGDVARVVESSNAPTSGGALNGKLPGGQRQGKYGIIPVDTKDPSKAISAMADFLQKQIEEYNASDKTPKGTEC